MRVLLASIVCEKADVSSNLARHTEVLGQARRSGCDIAVFPEFSLTGSVNPLRRPSHAVDLEDPVVAELVEASAREGVGTIFGLAERSGAEFFVTQAYAEGGHLVGVQRKRHLGDGEDGYTAGTATAFFEYGGARFGLIICAEAGVDFTWDACVAAGASVVFMTSAPGLYGRRTDETSWQRGFEWWESGGLGDARHHSGRLGIWVAMATQAGSTHDEDFPGIAALVSPSGQVVERLPDWRPGTLVVGVPV